MMSRYQVATGQNRNGEWDVCKSNTEILFKARRVLSRCNKMLSLFAEGNIFIVFLRLGLIKIAIQTEPCTVLVRFEKMCFIPEFGELRLSLLPCESRVVPVRNNL